MVLTDTHTHFYYETDPGKRDEMLQRCLDKNISRLFLPNVDAASAQLVFDLTNAHPQYFFPMLGLHPCDVKPDWQTEIDAIMATGENERIYAIGEIGVDLYWDKTTLDIQTAAFEYQIQLAKQLDLPIVIHCRDAFNEVYDILQRHNDDKLRGIFHCFGGTVEQAQQIIDLGFYLGIGGVVTYKNSGLDKALAQLSLQHIVLETDAPYLTPVPFRGKPNESSYLTYIAEKVADIFMVDVAQVADITTANSKAIFGI
ncbi:TatD family hydrolase [Mucilaginibacter ginkgonis]|uniref:TatD family hydrolase n=1 Tax=Mucilaginibacter ginkgonis TaxID=2682091 RepID=A0A6I4I2L5_9SPHI|nr:TatD family hydrolase [Mucilaginibacter ginkgonis]QQL49007.1 TatD family hydrolase [Mucilaginibacter ginkgonis]